MIKLLRHDLSRETIKQAPTYTEESLLTRDYETGLHRHYNRQGYWVDEPVAKKAQRKSTITQTGLNLGHQHDTPAARSTRKRAK